jgi:predicted nucleic acid-binding protein
MRIFVDANVLFSAARSAGAIRTLLQMLQSTGHALAADAYVVTEARRNLEAKAGADAQIYLQGLLAQMEVRQVSYAEVAHGQSLVGWLPEKDRPVLLAAMAMQCDVLLTGDRTHFGAGYGKTFAGVMVYVPAQLARELWASPD